MHEDVARPPSPRGPRAPTTASRFASFHFITSSRMAVPVKPGPTRAALPLIYRGRSRIKIFRDAPVAESKA